MSQFRNTSDILDEVLTKAGEPTNGNSPFETLALTYLNKVHHAILAGGSILNLQVDESWSWARARQPITFELSPAYSNGSATFTTAATTLSFSSAPTDSLEGWHIKSVNNPTVYRIMNHTAGATTAQIDSNWVDSTGGYVFRAFKLDYEILPSYLYVDGSNDRVDWKESAGTTLSTTLTHGTYSPATLITHVAAKLTSGGTASWSGAYGSTTKLFSLTNNVTASLLAASGPNARYSVCPTLGFDRLNITAFTNSTGSYVPNGISRLMEPLKIFTAGIQPFIYSSDPIRMQEDYPISQVGERVPDRFVRLTEESDGTVRIRLNSYPKDKLKVTADWIPVPLDLQDNAASIPLLPRTDMDVLIHGAAAMILFDKEDTKWEPMLKLCSLGLEAMQAKNRALLQKTGELFGQMVPRGDLAWPSPHREYGYDAGNN